MPFTNVYEDDAMAEAYSKLAFANTYHLAFRDIPELVREHVRGRRALDFGCGTGRSTRFLRGLGLEAVGVDISAQMVEVARRLDPGGDYRVIRDGDFSSLPPNGFDLVMSAFTFDNIPTGAWKATLLRGLGGLLAPSGRLINLVSSPDIYTHEWASFTTRDFPENASAGPGDLVRIVSLDIEDRRPAVDVLWTDEAYRETYRESSLEVLEVRRPLATGTEPYRWVSETRVAPWVIYVLCRADRGG
jgi:SAM-dependent methyltransferase